MSTLRADAQRNLDRVLVAATECFAESGVNASVDEIARRAGVGHGTVFRRFPTKEALIAAVIDAHVTVLTAVAEEGRREPGGFERFIRVAAESYAENRGLLDAMTKCRHTQQIGALREAVQKLVRKAQLRGEVRRDVKVDDVLALIPAASQFPDVILDGLRPPAGR
ncbi:MAG TPA: helix-turn-helix domain-containing protein [Gaiellaceae bacterium]|jgi:AcrR family transcriptional regulator